MFDFYRQPLGMGVGEQNSLYTMTAQRGKQWQGILPQPNLMAEFNGHGVNIQIKPLAPVIETVPIEGVPYRLVFPRNQRLGLPGRDAPPAAQAFRHQPQDR